MANVQKKTLEKVLVKLTIHQNCQTRRTSSLINNTFQLFKGSSNSRWKVKVKTP